MFDAVQLLFQVDQTTWTIVLTMAMAGAIYVGHATNGAGLGVIGFVCFVMAGLTVLAIMRATGVSFTMLAGGDAVLATTIGMTIAALVMIGLIAAVNRY